MNKKIVLIILIVFVIISIIGVCIFLKKRNHAPDNGDNQEELQNIIDETGVTADSDLYEVNVEDDGTKTIEIKADLQYKIAFAGIIKKSTFSHDDVEKIFNDNYPKETGIWIDAESRDNFLSLIGEVTNDKYSINENGYLKIDESQNSNENDKLLKKLINGKKRFIIDISGIYFAADRVTGEILDNYFELMDPHQASKIVETENDIIIILSTNSEKLLKTEDILEELIGYAR